MSTVMRGFALLASLATFQACGAGVAVSTRLPEFTHRNAADWINSGPLTLEGLKGQVVLLEFWTFDCINCRRTLPWLKAVHARYGDEGLVIVAVHSPEFAAEREPDNVRTAVRRLGIEYPVMLDADFSYWNALGNRYWPAIYLVDRKGRVAAHEIGELHQGTARGDGVEQEIRRLLADLTRH